MQRKIYALAFSFLLLFTSGFKTIFGQDVHDSTDVDKLLTNYKMVWNDEFNGTEMNQSKWSYRSNGSVRNYATVDGDKTISLDGNGHLVLKVTKEGDQYYVGQATTDGHFNAKYGYYECRAKMNQSIGPHIAFWLQSPSMGNTPYNQPNINGAEVDIFEYHRLTPDTIWQTIHINGYGAEHQSQGAQIKTPDIDTGFHTFGLLWTDKSYTFYIDGKKTYETSFGLSQRTEFMILSTELTGFGGNPNLGNYPDSVVYDYVRVYQQIQPDSEDIKIYDSTTIKVAADTYTYDAASGMNSNFGSSTTLASKFGGGTAGDDLAAAVGYNRRTYLKFPTAALKSLPNLQRVCVRMQSYNKDIVNLSKGIKLSISSDASWNEHTITWNNQDAEAGTLDSLTSILDDGAPKADNVPTPLTDDFINSYNHYIYLDISDTIKKMMALHILPDTISLVLQGYAIGTGTQQYNTGYYYLSKDFTNTNGQSVDSLAPSLVLYSLAQSVPVRSSNLTAKLRSNQSVQLNWTIFFEQNVSGYIIEKSKNGKDFTQIASITASNNGSQVKNYRYIDEQPNTGTTYYRWKELTLNGETESISNIASITINSIKKTIIYPNPVKKGHSIIVNVPDKVSGNIEIRLINRSGIIMKSYLITAKSNSPIQISTSGLDNGVYFLTLSGNNFNQKNKLIIK